MHEQTKRNLDYYGRWPEGAADYARYMAAPRFRAHVVVEQLRSKRPASVLDLGCGEGTLLLQIREALGSGVRLAGVDLSEGQIAENRRSHPEVEWIAGNIEDESLVLERQYEAIVATEVIEHLADPGAFLRAARRFAAPGASLVLTTQSGRMSETERRVGHFRHFTREEMTRLLESAGWQVERVWNAGFPFHNLSKWAANLSPEQTMRGFGTKPYGWGQRAVAATLRGLFTLNSRRRGAQLFALAHNGAATRSSDAETADAFAQSWNRIGSVYTDDQFRDWFAPITPDDLRGSTVIELGFGNGSLLDHVARCVPARLVGIDYGDTIEQTRRNLKDAPVAVELSRGDLTTASLGEFDIAYCIGVLHHLERPDDGFRAVLRHTRPGGRFHCSVYSYEGNALVRLIVEPVRRVASRLPWWVTKYLIALPMVTPYYLIAKTLRALRLDGEGSPLRWLPLWGYTRWIAPHRFGFFHHVAFDQLVTPRTRYLDRRTIERWLADPELEPGSQYMILRNGNSWKFGGKKRR